MNKFSFFIGLRYTFSRKQSHLLAFISRISTIGMVLAVSVLITVMSVMNGFDKALKEDILSMVPHATLSGLEASTQWRPLIVSVKAHGEVADASPFTLLQALLVNGNSVKSTTIYGVDPFYESDSSMLRKLLSSDVLAQLKQEKTMILGRSLAEKLNVSVGQTVKILVPAKQNDGLPKLDYFLLIGVLDSGTELDEKIAVIYRENVAALKDYPSDAVDGIRISVNDLFAAKRIAEELGQLTGLYYVRDWSRSHGNLFHAVQMSRKLVLLLVFVIVAVAAFNVVSTLVLAANEKSSDIAILRTMGCTRRQIMGIFVMQGVAIGFVGVLLGIALGIILSFTVSDGVRALESLISYQFLTTDVYPIDHLPSDIRLWDVVLVAVLAQLLSLFATWLPAWKASRIEPAKILRYE